MSDQFLEITLRVKCNKDAEINLYHVCEEVQSYLDAHCSYVIDYESGDYASALITSYQCKWDDFTPINFPEERDIDAT